MTNDRLQAWLGDRYVPPKIAAIIIAVEPVFNSYAAHVRDWNIEDEADYEELLDELLEQLTNVIR